MSLIHHIERFPATIERKEVDRPATWLGIPDGKAHRGLFAYFRVGSIQELIARLDDDIVPVELLSSVSFGDSAPSLLDSASLIWAWRWGIR